MEIQYSHFTRRRKYLYVQYSCKAIKLARKSCGVPTSFVLGLLQLSLHLGLDLQSLHLLCDADSHKNATVHESVQNFVARRCPIACVFAYFGRSLYRTRLSILSSCRHG